MTQEKRELTALVIDDEDDIRELMIELLKEKGLRTDQAAYTNEGLELIKKNHYDIVLTDLTQAPTGIEVYNAAIARGMTAYIMSGGGPLLQEAKKVAGENLIIKPFTNDHLFRIVDSYKKQPQS